MSPNALPGIQVSLGVFCTFLGISIGLFWFDTSTLEGEHLNENVMGLLGSLRFAFATSVAGMLSSLLVKIFPGLYRIEFENNDDFNHQIMQLLQRLTDNLDELTTTNRKKLDGIQKDVQSFFTDMTGQISSSVIAAFQKIVKDFNTEINKQLGESFVKFNESVSQMRDWQEENNESVLNLLITLKQQSVDFVELGKKIREMVEESDAFGRILRRIGETIETLKKDAGTIDEFATRTDTIIKEYQAINTEILEKQKSSLMSQLQVIQKEKADLTQEMKDLQDLLRGGLGNLKSQLTTSLEESVQQSDFQMKNSVEKTLGMLDKQLTEILEKLSKDYVKLLNNIHALVKEGERLRYENSNGQITSHQ